jgi:hypothetical protein
LRFVEEDRRRRKERVVDRRRRVENGEGRAKQRGDHWRSPAVREKKGNKIVLRKKYGREKTNRYDS